MNTANSPPSPTHKEVLSVAIPIMLSNVSTPLLGIVDTGVIGTLGDPAAIGAVAVGAMVFTIVFWAFGFLRMGTSGLVAQAVGRRDGNERNAILARAVLVALGLGTALVLLQWPIREVALFMLEGSDSVESRVRDYFNIRIWAAPAALANYALVGWFVGQARAKTALGLQLVLNTANILLDAVFVLHFDWGIAGIAAGTLCAQYIAASIGILVALRDARHMPPTSAIFEKEKLLQLFDVSHHIMVRTLALMFVFAWFTARGAAFGDTVLATNAILMHLVSSSAYFLDGLAHAAETFVGQAIGQGNQARLKHAIRATSLWAFVIAAILSALVYLSGDKFVALLTDAPAVRDASKSYLWWVIAAPLAGVLPFQLDGIFIGATRTREMRNAMVLSLFIFVVAWWTLQPWGNHGLWAALFVHYIARTATMLRYFPRVLRTVHG